MTKEQPIGSQGSTSAPVASVNEARGGANKERQPAAAAGEASEISFPPETPSLHPEVAGAGVEPSRDETIPDVHPLAKQAGLQISPEPQPMTPSFGLTTIMPEEQIAKDLKAPISDSRRWRAVLADRLNTAGQFVKKMIGG